MNGVFIPSVPLFRTTPLKVTCWPCASVPFTVGAETLVRFVVSGPVTVTAVGAEQVGPNHCTPSSTIAQLKLYVPGVVGAVAFTVNAALDPGLTGVDGSSTRPVPQSVLSCGFCEPSRCGVLSIVHGFVPVFCIVTVAVNVPPAAIVAGTPVTPTQEAPFAGGAGGWTVMNPMSDASSRGEELL